MNPAFSAPQLRTFLTLFQDIGLKVCIPSLSFIHDVIYVLIDVREMESRSA